jgi:hypothetical protein
MKKNRNGNCKKPEKVCENTGKPENVLKQPYIEFMAMNYQK